MWVAYSEELLEALQRGANPVVKRANQQVIWGESIKSLVLTLLPLLNQKIGKKIL